MILKDNKDLIDKAIFRRVDYKEYWSMEIAEKDRIFKINYWNETLCIRIMITDYAIKDYDIWKGNLFITDKRFKNILKEIGYERNM